MNKILRTGIVASSLAFLVGCDEKNTPNNSGQSNLTASVSVPTTAPTNVRPSYFIASLPATQYASSPFLTVSDMNGDSLPDIVTIIPKNSSSEIYVLYNRGDGTYSPEMPRKSEK